MSSKFVQTSQWILGTSFLALSLLGCDRFLHGSGSAKENPNRAIVIQAKEVECLQTFPEKLKGFFDDELDDINPQVQCLKTALHTFSRRFEGDNAEFYTSQELQHFLNRYLLKKNQISDSFLAEIMKVKVALVGGVAERLTRDEIQQINEFIDKVAPSVGDLREQMKTISFREKDRSKISDLDSVQKNLNALLQFAIHHTALIQSHYEFSDFEKLLSELDQFLADSTSLKSVLRWMPLAKSIKVLFLGEHAKLFTRSEWIETSQWVVSVYVDVLEFYYQIKDLKYQTPLEWETFMAWIDRSLGLVESSPMMLEHRSLTTVSLDQLVDHLLEMKLFKTDLSPSLIKETYKKVLIHFIQGLSGDQAGLPSFLGLTDEHLRLLREEYHIWQMGQLLIDQMYLQKSYWSVPEIRSEIQNAPVEDLIGRVGATPLEQEDLLQSWQDWVQLISLKPMVVYNSNLRMSTMYNNDLTRTNFAGMNMLNATRSLVRFFFKGYGDHSSPFVFKTQMSEAGLVQLEEDFREIGRAIGFLDKRQANPAQRTFKEGNFFSYHGNGDKSLSPTEFYEQVNILITDGALVVGSIFDDLKSAHCLTEEKDIFGHPMVMADCFLPIFRKNLKVYLHHIPWMADYLNGLSDDQFQVAYQSLMAVARAPEQLPNRTEWSEIRTIATVLQYVESIYTVYDTDHDQRLSEDEILAALPRFAPFISSISPLGDHMMEDIFLYLIYNGQKPAGLSDILKFKAKRMTGLPPVSRINLLKVVGVLKTEAK